MAIVDYPLVPISRSTRITPRESISYDFMSDGTPAGRIDTQKEVYDAEIRHEMINQAAVDILLDHYRDNRPNLHRLSYAGKVYDLGFTGEPRVEEVNGIWRNVISRMVGSRVPV